MRQTPRYSSRTELTKTLQITKELQTPLQRLQNATFGNKDTVLSTINFPVSSRIREKYQLQFFSLCCIMFIVVKSAIWCQSFTGSWQICP